MSECGPRGNVDAELVDTIGPRWIDPGKRVKYSHVSYSLVGSTATARRAGALALRARDGLAATCRFRGRDGALEVLDEDLVGGLEVGRLAVQEPLELDAVHERDDLGGSARGVEIGAQLADFDPRDQGGIQPVTDDPAPLSEVVERRAAVGDALAAEDGIEAGEQRILDEDPGIGITPDRAYWIADIDPADAGYADVDALSHGCGNEPITETTNDVGTRPSPWIAQNIEPVCVSSRPIANRVDLDLSNVASLSIDLEEACLTGTNLVLHTTSDRPTRISFTDGRTVTLPVGERTLRLNAPH